jgi:ABC-2 type transport system permease protein
MKASIFRRPLQIATFMRKETVDVLRQPRLLLTLVIGPFLIMAAFGIGYRDTPQVMRTLFVAPAGSPFLDRVETYADDLGSYVEYAGVTTDSTDARRQLVRGDVDLVVSFPDDPLSEVLSGERAAILVHHTRLDPIEQTAITFASRIAIDQINGEILAAIVEGGQALTRPAEEIFAAADVAATEFESATQQGDEQAAQAAIDQLQDLTAQLSLTTRLTDTLTERMGGQPGPALGQQVETDVESLRQAVAQMDSASTVDAATTQLSTVQGLLDTVDGHFDELTSVDPSVLVRPFRSDVELAVSDTDQVTDWYAPAAVVLMLQQFGVAFGALSFVRERQLGITDVFRVAPVNATETLIGKYLAYLVIGSAIGAALTASIVAALNVKMAASITDVAIVMLLSLFASIGVGFVISLASSSDAQAVQYTMILLLASLFFSGFFLSVGQMEGVARVVGWLLPVTYGMRLLRDVMLRGASLDLVVVAGLAGFGIGMFGLALFATNRRLAGAQ